VPTDDGAAERPTLLLIDGHALVYRAFFAMPALTNSRGELTNAAYGFTSMLLKAFSEHRPEYAIAAFDPPGPTFRHEEMAAYKAQRPPMPEELRPRSDGRVTSSPSSASRRSRSPPSRPTT